MTPDAIAIVVMQAINVAILGGIFFRLGRLGERVTNTLTRVEKLEKAWERKLGELPDAA